MEQYLQRTIGDMFEKYMEQALKLKTRVQLVGYIFAGMVGLGGTVSLLSFLARSPEASYLAALAIVVVGAIAFVSVIYTVIKIPSGVERQIEERVEREIEEKVEEELRRRVEAEGRRVKKEVTDRFDPVPPSGLPDHINVDANLSPPPIFHRIRMSLETLGYAVTTTTSLPDPGGVSRKCDWAKGYGQEIALVSLPEKYFVAREWKHWYFILMQTFIQTFNARPDYLFVFTDAKKIHNIAIYESSDLEKVAQGTKVFLISGYLTDRFRSAQFRDNQVTSQLKTWLSIDRKMQFSPVREQLKGLKDRDLRVLKVLMNRVQHNRWPTRAIKDSFSDLAVNQVYTTLKNLEKRKLVGSEKSGRMRVWGIIDKATYQELTGLIG